MKIYVYSRLAFALALTYAAAIGYYALIGMIADNRGLELEVRNRRIMQHIDELELVAMRKRIDSLNAYNSLLNMNSAMETDRLWWIDPDQLAQPSDVIPQHTIPQRSSKPIKM